MFCYVGTGFTLSSLYVFMAIKHIIVLFVETPRKFITAKLSIRKCGSSSALIICHIISTDEDPGLRIESFAVINLRSVSTNKTIIWIYIVARFFGVPFFSFRELCWSHLYSSRSSLRNQFCTRRWSVSREVVCTLVTENFVLMFGVVSSWF